MSEHAFHVIRLESVGSTQDAARSLARSACSGGTVVLAEEQTAGRGRGERAWDSPRGLGLWLTLIHRSIRPEREWPALTVAAAVAVCETLGAIGLHPRTRWPNDVLLADRKVSGVLADIEGNATLIGIGLNHRHEVADFPSRLREIATSIRIESARAGIHPPDREELLAILLFRLNRLILGFERSGPDAAVSAFWDRAIDQGKRITVRLPSAKVIEGRAIGLGEIGQLLVEGSGGTVSVSGGTVLRREAE